MLLQFLPLFQSVMSWFKKAQSDLKKVFHQSRAQPQDEESREVVESRECKEFKRNFRKTKVSLRPQMSNKKRYPDESAFDINDLGWLPLDAFVVSNNQ